MRMSAEIQPGRILEANALDDQLVAFPAPKHEPMKLALGFFGSARPSR